mmetsp:Transcript_58304/g.104399  ORF Transcript_58304/g.104399 Transcript_58304/m.104399 type:complete len:83 (+) Transcript_58304:28-276(+)
MLSVYHTSEALAKHSERSMQAYPCARKHLRAQVISSIATKAVPSLPMPQSRSLTGNSAPQAFLGDPLVVGGLTTLPWLAAVR